jgi:putative Mg2+ transporter-C (MgtC) family protein
MEGIAFQFEWDQFLSYLFKMVVAFVLALPTAWEREYSSRQIGLRTFPLVAIASCSYVLVAVAIVSPDSEEAKSRIIQGLMTGIGFIGGGAILKYDNQVHGTSTAASIWSTGALGAAVGYAQYEIAVIIALLTCLTLRLLKKAKPDDDDEK